MNVMQKKIGIIKLVSQIWEAKNMGQIKKEYLIKLNTAKEMVILEHNTKGKQVRWYFISVEEKYKEQNICTP